MAQSYIQADPKDDLRKMCETAGFVVHGVQVRLIDHVSTDWLVGADASFDREHFAVYCERMAASVNGDPSAAIGAAKELVEAVCKYVLRVQGTPAGSDDNISVLSKNALRALDLSTEAIPSAQKGAASMKKVLGSMSAVVQGMAELRNLYGSGHGRDGKLRGVKPRHAKLAVGAATTLSTFLLETLEERHTTSGP